MSNTEVHPPEVLCTSSPGPSARVEVLTPRSVPLGGPRAMTVRRTLPQRARSLIGAWCFADHYGPDDVAGTGGMDVAPHPHTGLQTVSWLFTGEIEHRDSLGSHAMVRPGEINLMTGGHGIAHTEVSTPSTTVLHGVQLWVALPAEHRDAPRDFRHHVPEPVALPGGAGEARVFLGSLLGSTSPVPTFTPLLGAELVLAPGATVSLPVDESYEHGLLLDTGALTFPGGHRLAPAELGYLAPGHATVDIANPSADESARVILLGGPPFGEEIVMWWNFVGRSHDEIAEARAAWEARSDRFGVVEGYPGVRLPAPALPNIRLQPRRNPVPQTPPAPDETTQVRLAAGAHRYEILVEGTVAGFTEFRDHGAQRVFFHTVVEDAYAGRGLASVLVREALNHVRTSGMRLVPICPYVAKYLTKHDGFRDITDEDTREIRSWLKAELGS
ncbi:redox-sensitive bicupin YhaK (pirin superfamily)/predicted GNAT family acetyltransferase [Streptomyces sp. MJP52]|nr:redox-sensitive bicupin YhaK (pirin superfamily)/predicted GNAT family acetyltransferase [Streptomyces sp. MJP52]